MWRVWVRRGGCIGSWWGNRGERDRWGDLGVDGWIILGWISRTGLAQDRDRWRTLVSAVMNLMVPWNAGNFLTSCKPVSFSRRILHHGVIIIIIIIIIPCGILCKMWVYIGLYKNQQKRPSLQPVPFLNKLYQNNKIIHFTLPWPRWLKWLRFWPMFRKCPV